MTRYDTQSLGRHMAALAYNVSPEIIPQLMGEEEAYKEASEVGVNPLSQKVAGKIAEIYKQAEATDTLGYYLFPKLAASPEWDSSCEDLVECALRGLAIYDYQEKEAKMEPGQMMNFAKGTAALPAGYLGNTLAVATPVGLAGGVLNWLVSRDIKEDEANNEVLKQKILQYRRMTAQMDRELKHRLSPRDAQQQQMENAVARHMRSEV